MICASCGVSDKRSFKLIFVGARDDRAAKTYFCLTCGYGFTVSSQGNRGGEVYLSGEYFEQARSGAWAENMLTKSRLRVTEKKAKVRASRFVNLWKSLGRSRGSILEVGCGIGSFIAQMRLKKWNVEGIEPDKKFADAGATHYGISIHPTLFEDYKAPKTFDATTSFHVLEHVSNLHSFLDHARSILNENGLLFAEVPTIDHPHKKSWNEFFWTMHVNVFTADYLKRLFAMHGFDVIRCRLTSKFLYVAALKGISPTNPDIRMTLLGRYKLRVYLAALAVATNGSPERWRRFGRLRIR
jgi:2-polyprenyl-3-methyl-5-hydroxy-6-metoxy-1,4-benzoquinol methylase